MYISVSYLTKHKHAYLFALLKINLLPGEYKRFQQRNECIRMAANNIITNNLIVSLNARQLESHAKVSFLDYEVDSRKTTYVIRIR